MPMITVPAAPTHCTYCNGALSSAERKCAVDFCLDCVAWAVYHTDTAYKAMQSGYDPLDALRLADAVMEYAGIAKPVKKG